jgi:tetratricopeptide (TPR) repeat protein
MLEGFPDPLRWGRYWLVAGDAEKAVEKFKEAVTIAEASEWSYGVATQIGLGMALERMGRLEEAVEAYRHAVERLEEVREGLSPNERARFFEGKDYGFRRLEAYEGLVRVLKRMGKLDEAFRWAEHTKGRMLSEAMAKGGSSALYRIPKGLRYQEEEIAGRLSAMRKRIEEARAKGNLEMERQLEKEFKVLRSQQREFVERLRREYPEYASIQYPQPLSPSELAMGADEVLLEYEVTSTETIVFLVSGGKVLKCYSVNVSREELEGQVREYRESMEEIVRSGGKAGWSDFKVSLAKRLYEELLKAGIEGIEGNKKVIIVPDEVLCLLPFEALVVSVPSGEIEWVGVEGKGVYPKGVRYVGDDRVISYWQSGSSMSVWRRLKKRVGGGQILVVADPIYNSYDERLAGGVKWEGGRGIKLADVRGEGIEWLRRVCIEKQSSVTGHLGWEYVSRLPDTGEFAKGLEREYGGSVRVMVGAEACESKVLAERFDFYGSAVLFALHGVIDERTPYFRQAALLLSNPLVIGEPLRVKLEGIGLEREIDGYLTMQEVMELEMPTELVGALACHTGEGGIMAGEGVMNLGRAFQYAGARSVLVSLWGVSGESTNMLTKWMLEGMRSGKSKDDALLEARRRLRQAGYEHPFYWAPFILIGERDMVGRNLAIGGSFWSSFLGKVIFYGLMFLCFVFVMVCVFAVIRRMHRRW